MNIRNDMTIAEIEVLITEVRARAHAEGRLSAHAEWVQSFNEALAGHRVDHRFHETLDAWMLDRKRAIEREHEEALGGPFAGLPIA